MKENMENNPKVLVYIDNSNIFINAQVYSAKKKRFLRTVKDVNIRIDMSKMVDLARNGRFLMRGRLYGSEPSKLDSLWEAIREKQIEVYPSERSLWNNKEKMIDTALSVAATEDVIIMREKAGEDRAIILFTGDLDMFPLVQMSLKYQWNVEIWSFKSALSGDLRNEPKVSESRVKIIYLDDHFDEITFPALYFSGTVIPPDRSFVIKFEHCLGAEEHKFHLLNFIEAASKLFQLPFKGSFVPSSDPTELILIPSIREVIQVKGQNDVIYDFNGHIWRRIQELKDLIKVTRIVTFLEYLAIKNEYEVESRNIIDVKDDEIEEYDAEVAAGAFITIRRKTEKSKQQFSKSCSYDYRCNSGISCRYNHKDSEKEFFREHPTFNRNKYKSILCNRGNSCLYLLASHKCGFAHGYTEARCLRCHKVGVHPTNKCNLN